MKKAVKERAVIEEKVPKLLVNGKDTMTVCNIDELEGHRGSALHGVQITTGGAETAMAAERDKFEFPTVRAAIHGTAKRRVAAVNHFFNILNDRVTRM